MKLTVPNIHNLASTLWLWWRSLWSNGIEKRGHSTNRFSPSTTHFIFIFHPEHIPIHLFFYFQTENVERKDMRERDNSNTPEVVWELFCKTWEFILHNDLENAHWVIVYGTGLEFILHTTRGLEFILHKMRGARIFLHKMQGARIFLQSDLKNHWLLNNHPDPLEYFWEPLEFILGKTVTAK